MKKYKIYECIVYIVHVYIATVFVKFSNELIWNLHYKDATLFWKEENLHYIIQLAVHICLFIHGMYNSIQSSSAEEK